MSVLQLSQESSRLLCSSTIITSIFSVVKELLENALDAGTTNIDVKLENNGLQKIEVRDNGAGIEKSDVDMVAKPHFTSKITSVSDLEHLETYGFRGEALGAICAIGQLSITTKTKNDEISKTYVFDKTGNVKTSKPSASSSGTTVIVQNLFHNIPVRKKYYKSEKHRKDEMKRIEDLLCAYACAQTGTRFTLFNNQNLIWSKTASPDLKVSLIQVFGSSVLNNLERRYRKFKDNFEIEAYLPKPGIPPMYVSRSNCDRTIVVINKRPVKVKAIEKLLQDVYCYSSNESDARNRYPVCFLSLILPPSEVDVNVDPNKSQILLHNFEELLETLSNFLQEKTSTEIDNVVSIPYAKSGVTPTKNRKSFTGEAERLLQPKTGFEILSNTDSRTDISLLEKENFVPKEPSRLTRDCSRKRDSGVSAGSFYMDCNDPSVQSMSLLSETSYIGFDSMSFNVDGTCKGNKEKSLSNSAISRLSAQITSNGIHDQPVKANPISHITNKHKSDNKVNGEIMPNKQQTFRPSGLFQKTIDSEPIVQQLSNLQNCTSNVPAILVNGLTGSKSIHHTETSSFQQPVQTFSIVDVPSITGNKDISISGCKSQATVHVDTRTVKPTANMQRSIFNNPGLVNKNDELKLTSIQPHIKALSSVADNRDVQLLGNNSLISVSKTKDMLLTNSNRATPNAENNNTVKIPEKPKEFHECNQNSSSTANLNTDFVSARDVMARPNWSAGIATVNGKEVQPVRVLTANQQNKRIIECEERQALPKRQKAPISRHASPKGEQRSLSAFEFFCQEKRLETALQNPGMSNKEMGCLFLEQWKSLPAERQQLYQEKAKGQNKRSPQIKNTKNIGNLSPIGDTSEEPVCKKKKTFCNKKCEKLINFDFNTLRNFKMQSNKREENDVYRADSPLKPIGSLSSGVWICSGNGKLQLLNSNRIRESLLFHRLLETLNLKCDLLLEPITLSPHNLGDEESYKTLLLQCMKESGPQIMCEWFIGNGFTILFSKESCTVQLIAMASVIPDYGLEDLREVLHLLNNNTPHELSECRPSKVIQYIKSEAVRISRQSLVIGKENEMNDLLRQTKKYSVNNFNCLHNKPFYHELFHLSSILKANKIT